MKKIIKKNQKFFITIMVISLFCTNNFVFGNIKMINKVVCVNKDFDPTKAVFNNRNSLVLDASSALVDFYTANTSILNFISKEDGQKYFDKITDNLLSYQYNFETSTVLINIHLESVGKPWAVSDWNNYINAKLNP